MAEVVVRVCDVCRRANTPTSTFKIENGGVKITADLCDRHAAPLVQVIDIVANGAPPPAPARRAKPANTRTKLTTPEEIEALKKSQADESDK